MRSIIFCKNNFIQKIFFWSKKYAIKEHLKDNTPNQVVVDNDILGAYDYRLADYKASLIVDDIYSNMIDKASVKYLIKWGGLKFTKELIGKRIMYEAKNIFISIFYAQKVIEKFNIKETVYLYPYDFEIDIFNYLNNNQKIPYNIKILKTSYYYLYIKSKFKALYFLFKSLALIERTILTLKSNTSINKNKAKFCAYMDDGLSGWQTPLDKLIIGDDSIKKNNIIFINKSLGHQRWINEYKEKNYNIVDFKKLTNSINYIYDRTSFFKKYFKIKFRIISIIIRYPWLSSTLYNHFNQRILWDIFYDNYETKNIISTMTMDDITASYIHKKNNIKTIFLYYSVTTNILKDIKEPSVSHCHDYTHMNYDIVVSNKISNNWLKKLQNKVDQYVDIGPLFSDLIIERSKNKKILLEKLKITNPKKIISCIDSPTGLYAVSNNKSYEDFLDCIVRLSNANHDNYYLLKTKKSFSFIKSHSNKKINDLLDKTLQQRNIIYMNDLNISAYDTIGLSDLTISGPQSSALFESFFAGNKTICYDPYLQYKDSDAIENHIPNCKASTYYEISKLHDYWLNDVDESDFMKYLKEYIDGYFGTSCGMGKSISRLRNFLYNNCKL